MKNKSISGFGKSYIRLFKVSARKMFDDGNELNLKTNGSG